MHFSQFNLILEHWGDRKRGNGHQVVGIVSQADWSLINKTDQNKHASKDVDKGLFPKAKSYLASACQARKSVAGSNLSGPTWDKTKFNFLFLINELSRIRQFHILSSQNLFLRVICAGGKVFMFSKQPWKKKPPESIIHYDRSIHFQRSGCETFK